MRIRAGGSWRVLQRDSLLPACNVAAQYRFLSPEFSCSRRPVSRWVTGPCLVHGQTLHAAWPKAGCGEISQQRPVKPTRPGDVRRGISARFPRKWSTSLAPTWRRQTAAGGRLTIDLARPRRATGRRWRGASAARRRPRWSRATATASASSRRRRRWPRPAATPSSSPFPRRASGSVPRSAMRRSTSSTASSPGEARDLCAPTSRPVLGSCRDRGVGGVQGAGRRPPARRSTSTPA